MAVQAKQASPTRVVTGECRLSYVRLNAPYAKKEGADKKYSCVVLIPKSDKVTEKKLRRAQQAALAAGATSKFGGKVPKVWTDTIHDGDEEADLDTNPEMEGHWFLTVSNFSRPGIVDRYRNEITDPDEVYSGMYARVAINAFPFNTDGNKGVSFGLDHVQKLRDGDRFDGRVSVDDVFDDLDELDDDDLI